MQTEHARTLGNQAPFFTVGGLATYLHVSKTTVYRLVERRHLPVHRVEGCLRFAREDVETYLRGRRVPDIQDYEHPKNTQLVVG